MPDDTAQFIARLLTLAGRLRREAGLPTDVRGYRLIRLAEALEEKAHQLLQQPLKPRLETT